MTDPAFRTDLFRGAGQDYDRFRLAYPRQLVDDLVWRSGADGAGRLLDLACGTGQLAFAMRGRFAKILAADQEPDMIRVVRAKARAAGAAEVSARVAAAEDLSVPAGTLDLIAVGNAFHRLQRDAVAQRMLRWLRPGGHVALVWSDGPSAGDEPWQRALAATMRRWRDRAEQAEGGGPRVPAGYDQARQDRPDAEVLTAAGFEPGGRFSFPAEHAWTVAAITGYLLATSVLSRQALGALAAEFEADVHRVLAPYAAGGTLRQVIDFGYELARRPPG
ncbi:MAG TPA: methyltransferase domain-containing protein [Streptosporangiaceae bacterium]|nr:methyltransferase domain-containing protein [Streptosporangiaceae bacterium]